jgi:chitinase
LLTQINYAFVLPTEAAECKSDDGAAAETNFPALRQLRQEHSGLQLFISIAGYGYDRPYQAIVQSPETMAKFVRSCVEFMQINGFDGIDLDWEYPKPAQKPAFTALLTEFRFQLDSLGLADGRHYGLTIAAPAGSQVKAYDLPAIAPLLDGLNLMAYDYYGTWIAVTGFNAPLYVTREDPQKLSADVSVQAYLSAGVPPEKLILGIPFYGRGWANVSPANDGLFQPYVGPAQGALAPGTFDYRELREKYIGVYPRHWEDLAQAAWLYDSVSRTMISYDDPQTVGLKAAYARQHGLGGLMIWQIAGDDRDFSLLNAIQKELR